MQELIILSCYVEYGSGTASLTADSQPSKEDKRTDDARFR